MESIDTTMDNGIDEDRISQLPDPILHQILSHFRTKHVLPTIILSKRWKNLWASMPYFFLDDYEQHHYSREADPNFITRVTSVLLLCDASDIHTFKLAWVCGFSPHGRHYLDTWVKHLIARNVKVLKINLNADIDFGDYGDTFELPNCIFACQSVVEMTLKVTSALGCFRPPQILLGRLRKLHLVHIELEFEFSKLMNGCPVLVDLKLQECWFSDLDISLNSLKRLCVKDCSFYRMKMKISAPSLNYFYFRGNKYFEDNETPEVLIENLSSLVHATIQLYEMEYVDTLRFTIVESKCASGDPGSSTFCNLKELILDCQNIKDDFEAVTFFLQRSPNLEKLVLDNEYLHYYGTQTKFYDCIHLKMEIVYQFGMENEEVIKLMEDFLLSKCDCSMETQQ